MSTPRGTRGTPKKPWQTRFLEAFRKTGLITEACKVAQVGRSTVYRERQANEDFALAWADVEQETTEMLEREAIRRAAEGVLEPVFYKGDEVGYIRKYSDTLLIFTLKARKPETYRESVHIQHSGGVNHQHTAVIVDEQLAADARDLLRRTASTSPS